jgi:serine protease AprX
MSRDTGGTPGDVRKSALWGSGNRGGEHRSNALWGKGGRGAVVGLVIGLMVTVGAGATSVRGVNAAPAVAPTFVEAGLLERAQQNPQQVFKLIIQSNASSQAAENAFKTAEDEDDTALKVEADDAKQAEEQANKAESRAQTKALKAQYRSQRDRFKSLRESLNEMRKTMRGDLEDEYEFIAGISVDMTGRRLLRLAKKPGLSITEDVQVKLALTDDELDSLIWPASSGLLPLRGGSAPKAPAIAIVDSGVDKGKKDFGYGTRVIASKVITTLQPNSPGDGRGHGTFVASIAAGNAAGRLGASPTSPIVDVDVMDDNGMARTSDVIAGAEWIYQNRDKYNIRVANFSLHASRPSNFTNDPLDKAVEKLWFGGVVVVAAAGNYGIPDGPSGVKFAPGNDPFVITVGALDLNGELNSRGHDVPSWSAYGRTYDGFMKPELSAAGRYMVGAIPAGSTLASLKASNLLGSSGYIRLSGTSFAAPVVAGAAAQILARHPDWTPDQVKGAMMKTARRLSPHEVPAGAGGVGEVNAWRASELRNPPNPNKALNSFVQTDPSSGAKAFNSVSWADAAKASVSWDAVSWSDVSWADVSWSDVSWADVSWSDVSWADVSWADVLAVADVSWEDAAGDSSEPPADESISQQELEAGLVGDAELFPPGANVVEAVDLALGIPVAAPVVAPVVAPVTESVTAPVTQAVTSAVTGSVTSAVTAPLSAPAQPAPTTP